VTVPVLRRDRSEALVHLAVRQQQTEDGRPVFVTDLAETSDADGAGG
jgi:hypothetical protein